jgi:hypothetical protein
MAADTQNHSFPPGIAKAIIEVTKALGTLREDHERTDGASYKYASIDDFIKHVRGSCAEAGLAIIPDEARDAETREVTTRNGKTMVMWEARFGFILIHESGESFGPIYKSVGVQYNGATAAGSAQSYALKQLFRGLFLIPTGDDDDPDKERVEISGKGEQQTDLQKTANTIRKKIRDADDPAKLGLVWSDCEMEREMIRGASESAHDFLEKEYRQRAKELEDA